MLGPGSTVCLGTHDLSKESATQSCCVMLAMKIQSIDTQLCEAQRIASIPNFHVLVWTKTSHLQFAPLCLSALSLLIYIVSSIRTKEE